MVATDLRYGTADIRTLHRLLMPCSWKQQIIMQDKAGHSLAYVYQSCVDNFAFQVSLLLGEFGGQSQIIGGHRCPAGNGSCRCVWIVF